MPWGKAIKSDTTVLSRTWEKDIARAKALAPPPPDRAIYSYLQAAYRCGRRTSGSDERKKAALRQLARTIPGHKKIVFNRYRLIIELTAPPYIKPRMRWKYGRVLAYADANRIRSGNVIQFIRNQGGINACVEKHKARG